jgi:hypothetical protein
VPQFQNHGTKMSHAQLLLNIFKELQVLCLDGHIERSWAVSNEQARLAGYGNGANHLASCRRSFDEDNPDAHPGEGILTRLNTSTTLAVAIFHRHG